MELEPIKVRVTIIGNNFSFSFEEDYTEYAQDLIECGNIYHNTGVPMTKENIDEYFKEGKFKDEEVEALNGNHFLFGFLEALGQSERCPDTLYTYQGELRYEVKRIQ